METIISIVVLVAIYSVVFVVKSLASKSADVKGTPFTGEVFPTIDILKPDSHAGHEPIMKENIVDHKRVSAKSRTSKEVTVEKPNENAAQQVSRKGISLKFKSEAKRAFIYTEILNRKY